jgi:hypothetical protein
MSGLPEIDKNHKLRITLAGAGTSETQILFDGSGITIPYGQYKLCSEVSIYRLTQNKISGTMGHGPVDQ